MLELCFCLAMIQCLVFAFLGRFGSKLNKINDIEHGEILEIPEQSWPKLGMIVPVAGAGENVKNALNSLLVQDYPNYYPIFVTATNDDPAVLCINELSKEYPKLRHIVAGLANGCGQKNHNLLQGISTLDDDIEIYTFCDSSHYANPDFLKCLVMPIVQKKCQFSTGYHIIKIEDTATITLSYALCVLLMRFLQAVSKLTQLWGGAMAMSKKAFVEHKVESLWKRTVVDDCSLTAYLQAKKIPVGLSVSALLETKVKNHNLFTWCAWLDRQILFLKFCIPLQWVLLGLFAFVMGLPFLFCLSGILGGFFGIGDGKIIYVALFWIFGVSIALSPWRKFLHLNVDLWQWMHAFLWASGGFCYTFIKSIFTKNLLWKNIIYKVGQGGSVLAAERRPE